MNHTTLLWIMCQCEYVCGSKRWVSGPQNSLRRRLGAVKTGRCGLRSLSLSQRRSHSLKFCCEARKQFRHVVFLFACAGHNVGLRGLPGCELLKWYGNKDWGYSQQGWGKTDGNLFNPSVPLRSRTILCVIDNVVRNETAYWVINH